MIRRPPRSTRKESSAASDVYKRQRFNGWAAMLGFVAAVGAYVTTGQIIPGWF